MRYIEPSCHVRQCDEVQGGSDRAVSYRTMIFGRYIHTEKLLWGWYASLIPVSYTGAVDSSTGQEQSQIITDRQGRFRINRIGDDSFKDLRGDAALHYGSII